MRRSIDMERATAGLSKVLGRSLNQAPAGEAPVLAWPLVCGSAVAERPMPSRLREACCGSKCRMKAGVMNCVRSRPGTWL